MSIYDDLIRRKEENNVRLEQSADRALLEDERLIRIENEMDDVQSALLCILERFGLSSDRLYGFHSIPNLLDSMLDPLGIMYDYTEDLSSHTKSRSSNILAFREDGAAVALIPEPSGYRYYFCITLYKQIRVHYIHEFNKRGQRPWTGASRKQSKHGRKQPPTGRSWYAEPDAWARRTPSSV